MEERKGKNGFNYLQIKQSTKTILVFHFILSYFNTSFFFLSSPRLSFLWHDWGECWSHTFLRLTKAKPVTQRAWGTSQQFQANHKSNPLEKKNEKTIEWSGAGSHSLRWNVPRSALTKDSNAPIARSFLCERDVIHCDAEPRESATHKWQALYEFYILIKIALPLSPALSLCLFACLFVSLSLAQMLHTLSHTLFTPLDVILPDYYSRGQSGIRTDPWHWHWLIGFLRCLLVFLCVCVCLSVFLSEGQ